MKPISRNTILSLILLIAAGSAFSLSRDWSLKDTGGNTFTLSEHVKGKPVLMMFWAMWCVPCKKELETFKDRLNFFSDSLGVEVLLIAIDSQKTMSRVKPYIESKGYTWTTLHDPDQAVFKMYGGGQNVPYTVLLDGEGATYHKILGEMKSIAALEGKIHELLGASPGE